MFCCVRVKIVVATDFGHERCKCEVTGALALACYLQGSGMSNGMVSTRSVCPEVEDPSVDEKSSTVN